MKIRAVENARVVVEPWEPEHHEHLRSRPRFTEAGSNLTPSNYSRHWNSSLTVAGNGDLYDGYTAYFSRLAAQNRSDRSYTYGNAGDHKYSFFPRAGGDASTDTVVNALDDVTCRWSDAAGSHRTTVHAAMPKITRQAVADKLRQLAGAGCLVDLVYSETDAGTWSALHGVSGITHRYYQHDDDADPTTPRRIVHSKNRLISGMYAGSVQKMRWTGSHNWSGPALRNNDEAMLRVTTASVHDAFEADFQAVRAAAVPGVDDDVALCRSDDADGHPSARPRCVDRPSRTLARQDVRSSCTHRSSPEARLPPAGAPASGGCRRSRQRTASLRHDGSMIDPTAPVVPPGRMKQTRQPDFTLPGNMRLRPWEESDAQVLVRSCLDPDVQHWNRPGRLTTDTAREKIERWKLRWQDEEAAIWAVTPADGTPVGLIGLADPDLPGGGGEFVYWLLPAGRGRGAMVDAILAVSRGAFDILGLHRLRLTHSVANTASCGVATRAGFAREGTMRSALLHADGWHDEHLHARIQGDTGPA
ncbi:hypothetical protein GCM10010275_14460 [Streptomyces litmocidini]|uniref:GNAT family N-acetyltransferase n=1 Tax=Streptomyces litmocidini TaxID=67318 RepID=UPI00167D637D|nr:GNAT family N-acetyltransferase [Streptomyces litmocidini]GGU80756.1 hypothetical protein GCM10010275_14460 [Streptomyces litmocidini]